jgi:hypothetical protein
VAATNQTVALQRKRKIGEGISDPLVLWIEDLTSLIQERKSEGCEIILTGDFNEDLQDMTSAINVLARKLDLREALLDKYNIDKGFSTYSRGSTVIDGVFLSQGLQISKGGYTSIDDSPGDHRWIWFDIAIRDIVGGMLAERARPLERKATSIVPSIKERFNYILNQQIQMHSVGEKTKQLVLDTTYQMASFGNIDEELQHQIDRIN